jgi:hypothetical protein
LLCFAQEIGENGVINRPISDIAWRLRQPERTIKSAISTLIELDILIDDDGLRFCNWSKRQYKSDNAAERKRKEREVKKQSVSRDMSQLKDATRPVLEQNRTEQIQSRADKPHGTQSISDSEPVPEPPPAKNAFFEKRNKEFAEVMEKIKAKYNPKEQYEIENWIKSNYRGKHPDALIHTLNSIVQDKRPDKPDKITLYLDLVLKTRESKITTRRITISRRRNLKSRDYFPLRIFSRELNCMRRVDNG